jgi:MtN3 and saliva related transmembrane protein
MDSGFLIGVIAAALTTFGFIPQIMKMYETKSAQDVSLVTLVQFCVGVLLWVVYGMSIDDPILIVANSVTFGTLVIAIVLYARYHQDAGLESPFEI